MIVYKIPFNNRQRASFLKTTLQFEENTCREKQRTVLHGSISSGQGRFVFVCLGSFGFFFWDLAAKPPNRVQQPVHKYAL
jgi:hypothetical protein